MNNQFWKTGLLVVSLLINALVIGILIGRGIPSKDTERGRRQPPSIEASDDTRRWVRGAMRDISTGIRPLQRDLRTNRQALYTAFSATPYDQAAVVEAMQAYQKSQQALREATQNALIAKMETASEDERRLLAQMAIRQGRGGSGPRTRRRRSPEHNRWSDWPHH